MSFLRAIRPGFRIRSLHFDLTPPVHMLRAAVPYLATYALRPFHRFFPDMLWRVDVNSDCAYLTFDDGPHPRITPRLIDTLAARDAKATFFLVGANAAKHPEWVRALHDAGHTIGNHTYTHPDAWTTDTPTLIDELERTTETLQQIIGEKINVMRPPYGHPTTAMREWCRRREQRMVMWDVMPGDYLRTATAQGIAAFTQQAIRPGSVIVLHDNPICENVTLDALSSIVKTPAVRFPNLPLRAATVVSPASA